MRKQCAPPVARRGGVTGRPQAADRREPGGLGFRWTAQQLASSTVAIPKAVGAGVPLGDRPWLLVLSIWTPPARRPDDLADLRLLLTATGVSTVVSATAVLIGAILIHAATPLLGR